MVSLICSKLQTFELRLPSAQSALLNKGRDPSLPVVFRLPPVRCQLAKILVWLLTHVDARDVRPDLGKSIGKIQSQSSRSSSDDNDFAF
jgi:hypothetical protein